MKHKTKNTLRALARHFGLKVKFVSYLPADVQGKLLPREKRILINAYKPRCEHTFTLLHEIGHYVQHVLTPRRAYHPRVFDLHWKNDFLAEFSKFVRRYFRFIFNKQSGKEWEADLWAMCAFIYLAKAIGCQDELIAFVKRHPEKTNIFRLAAWGAAYCGIKTRIKNASRYFLLPFSF